MRTSSKLIRYAAIGLGSLIALVVVVIGVIAFTFDPNQHKPRIVDFVKEKYGRTLAIDGTIGLTFFPRVGVSVAKVGLSERNGAKSFAKVEQAKVAVALLPILSKKVNVDRIELIGLDVDLVKHKDGTTNFDDLLGKTNAPQPAQPAPTPAGSTAPLAIDISGISLVNAAIGWRDESSGTRQHFTGIQLTTGRITAGERRLELANVKFEAKADNGLAAKLSAPKLMLGPDRSESSPIDLSLVMNTPTQKLDAKIALSAAKATGERVEFSSLAVQLDLKQGGLAVLGKLVTPVSLAIDANQIALSQLAGEFTVSGPSIPNASMRLAVQGRADANWAKKTLASDLVAKFDETTAKLKLTLADFTQIAPQFDLAVDRLNVDRYRTSAKPAGGGGAPSGGGDTAEKPIDLSALKTLQAAGSVHIGSLVAANVKAENVQARIKAAGGRVDVNPLSANLYQGSLAGSIAINAQTNQYTVREQLTNVAVGPLLRDALDKDLLEGRGTVTLDLVTTGSTVAALKRGLNGNANVVLRDGAIKGINLADIARRARALRSGNLEGASNVKAEKTDFSELTASFAIRNGVAHNEDLVMKSPFMRLSGAGDIDVASGSINYLAKAALVSTSTGQDGKEQADVRGITIPIRVSGPFEQLKYSVDVASLATDSAKEEIKRRVGDAIEKRLDERTKGRIGEAFKGLFGR